MVSALEEFIGWKGRVGEYGVDAQGRQQHWVSKERVRGYPRHGMYVQRFSGIAEKFLEGKAQSGSIMGDDVGEVSQNLITKDAVGHARDLHTCLSRGMTQFYFSFRNISLNAMSRSGLRGAGLETGMSRKTLT